MVDPISLKGKSNKDLLITVIITLNNLVGEVTKMNGMVADHEKRLIVIETKNSTKKGIAKVRRQKITMWILGLGLVVTIVISIIQALA